MRILFLTISLFFLFSCANTADKVANETLDGDYLVTEIKGENTPEDIIFNFSPVGNRISGNTGCNDFSAHYSQQGIKLEFSTPMNTRKYCRGKMGTERKILSFLEEAAWLDRNGEEIIVYSGKDVALLTLTKIE